MAVSGCWGGRFALGRGLGEWGVPVWAGGPVQKRERSYPLMTACLNCGLVVLRGWVVLF
jgi:hypothetical protein